MVGAPGLNSETWESTNLNRPYPLAASHIAAPVELSVQRDIDLIIEQLMGNIPGIHIDQLKVTHFGDDDVYGSSTSKSKITLPLLRETMPSTLPLHVFWLVLTRQRARRIQ